MSDLSIADEFMKAAVCGASKVSVIRHFKKYYNCSDSDIKNLIDLCSFKSEPKTINYAEFYNKLKTKDVNWFKFPFTQIGTIDNFLSAEECTALIDVIDENLRPSSVSNPDDSQVTSNYRTSKTADLHYFSKPYYNFLDKKICNFLDVYPFIGETIQAQRYEPGQYYKKHCDYFTPLTKEYKTYTEWMGQRTYTFMCYLNDVEEGGETEFKILGLKIKPKQGMAVVWNNLYKNGLPNPKTIHEALPPISGPKVVLTKWFRSWPLI
jgi:prolyl 4-hydroxylase